jgi:hypothetical protein
VEIRCDQNGIDTTPLHIVNEFVCRETSFRDHDVTGAAKG